MPTFEDDDASDEFSASTDGEMTIIMDPEAEDVLKFFGISPEDLVELAFSDAPTAESELDMDTLW